MNIDEILDECQSKKWESLNISHRGLVLLPARISELKTVKKLFLNDNHLILPPEEVRGQMKEQTISTLICIIKKMPENKVKIYLIIFK